MRKVRLWCEDLQSAVVSSTLRLDTEESHHLYRVLRLREGAQVELLNGKGLVAQALIRRSDQRASEATILDLQLHKQKNGLCLYGPAPKGKRLPYMLEKLQELGVKRWTPLVTQYSQGQQVSTDKSLHQRIRDACKQCGSPYLLEVGDEMIISELMSLSFSVLHMDNSAMVGTAVEKEWNLAYGPEGGWADEELRLFEKKEVSFVKLPGYVLRMETAAIAAAVLWGAQP